MLNNLNNTIMKKARLFLGAIVFMFAVASAFAFKVSSTAIEPAILVSGSCIKQEVTCSGGNNDCELQDGTKVREFISETSCGNVLQMP